MISRQIEVHRGVDDPVGQFEVIIREQKNSTRHHVVITRETLARIGRRRSPEEVIEASFRFLLDREAKEQILERFDVAVIGRYFPEFEAEIGEYFARGT